MILSNSKVIAKLADGLKVDGDLGLSGTHIYSLPDNLVVGKSLGLEYVRTLTKLPKGLRVGENLHLERSGITKIPDDIFVGGKIYKND